MFLIRSRRRSPGRFRPIPTIALRRRSSSVTHWRAGARNPRGGFSESSRKSFRDVKRFPAFDPPEYVDWKPDPALVRAFRSTLETNPERAGIVSTLTPDSKLQLYRGLLRARLHDIQLKRWVRTGVISKAWLGTGEEATTVGPVHALERGIDIVAPMIRTAGACSERGLSIGALLPASPATAAPPGPGRDLHVGSF